MTEDVEAQPVEAQAARYHHGRSPAGWAGSILALVGVLVCCIGTIPHFNAIVFTIGAVLFVVGGVAALVLRLLGRGND